jgi:hypothetical protein
MIAMIFRNCNKRHENSWFTGETGAALYLDKGSQKFGLKMVETRLSPTSGQL